jgi:hypothetical protein
MKNIFFFLGMLSSITCMANEQILYVASSLKDEASSEEAIMLVQCLTGDGHFSWQMQDPIKDFPNLVFSEEKEGGIAFEINTGKETLHKSSKQGSLLSECEASRAVLEKVAKGKVDLAPPSPWQQAASNSFTDAPEEPEKTKILPWVLAGAAVVAGVFFLWKSKQPNYNRIQSGT